MSIAAYEWFHSVRAMNLFPRAKSAAIPPAVNAKSTNASTGAAIASAPTNGHVHPMEKPGLGTRLLPDVVKRKDAIVRRTDSV